MASVQQITVEQFVELARRANAVLRKISSSKLDKVSGVRKLKRDWRLQNNKANILANELESQSERAICADDLMELVGIVCRSTNKPQEAFVNILSELDIEVTE